MNQDQSFAIIDATNAEVIAPDAATLILTKRQTIELEQYQDRLQKLQRPIAVAQEELGYLWLEAGLYLLKVRKLIPSVSRETDGKTGKFVTTQEGQSVSFDSWITRPELGYSRATAYRYMQGARNCGLTEESTFQDIIALKTANRLAGITPPKFGRRPVDKTKKQAQTHEYTEEERAKDYLAELLEDYRRVGQFLAEKISTEQTWMDLPEAEKEAFGNLLDDANRVYKTGMRKAKMLPSPKGKSAPQS